MKKRNSLVVLKPRISKNSFIKKNTIILSKKAGINDQERILLKYYGTCNKRCKIEENEFDDKKIKNMNENKIKESLSSDSNEKLSNESSDLEEDARLLLECMIKMKNEVSLQ